MTEQAKELPVLHRYFVAYWWQIGDANGMRRGTVDLPVPIEHLQDIIEIEKALMPSHLAGTEISVVNYQFMGTVGGIQ